MPEPLGDDLGRDTGGKGGAGVAVPDVVQPDPREAGRSGELLEVARPGTGYAKLAEEARVALLLEELATPRPLASPFVAYAEELGRSQGCKVMRLDTYEGNTPAAALYRKLGYRDAGKTKFNFYGIIEYLILLEKLL